MFLFTPEFGLAFWMLLVFLILFAVLAKFAWPAIIRSMEERAAFIDKGIEASRLAQEERQKVKEEVQALLADAHRQQMDVLQQTERLKREIIAKAQKTAEDEAKRISESARLAVEQAKRDAELQLRKQVASLSLQIAEKVIRKELASENEQVKFVGKLLNELENKE